MYDATSKIYRPGAEAVAKRFEKRSALGYKM